MKKPRGLAHGLFCVHCGAPPGERCQSESGRTLYRPHNARIALAIDLAAGRLDPRLAAGLMGQAEGSGVEFDVYTGQRDRN